MKFRKALKPSLITLTVAAIGFIYFRLPPLDIFLKARQVDRAAAAYRKAGLPWEAKDIAANPPVRDDENAAPEIWAAMKKFPDKTFNADFERLAQLADSHDWSGFDSAFGSYGTKLKYVEAAAAKPRIDFHRDYDQGAVLLLPEFSWMKKFVKALTLRAERHAAFGEVKECVEDLRRAWKISVLSGSETNMTSYLVGVACQRLTFESVQRCANSLANDRQGLEALAQLNSTFDKYPDFENALRGEVYLTLVFVRNAGDELLSHNYLNSELQWPETKPIRTGLPDGIYSRAFSARMMELWAQAQTEINKHHGDPFAIQQVSRDMERKLDPSDSHASTWFDAILFPSIGSIATLSLEMKAQRITNSVLLNALIVRATTGAFPDPVRGDVTDPFGSLPLIVKRRGEELRVYSRGPNGKDDGGFRKNELSTVKSDDIVAVYPALKRH